MVFLGNSAEFFEYANDIYGRMHTTKNVSGNWDRPPIPMNDWERLCKTAAKILVSRGLFLWIRSLTIPNISSRFFCKLPRFYWQQLLCL
jgi:hypothetical protein